MIRYTIHAIRRLQERGISKDDVEECLYKPDRDVPLKWGARRCIKIKGRYALVVIYKVDNKDIIVVTAFLTSKIDKYL